MWRGDAAVISQNKSAKANRSPRKSWKVCFDVPLFLLKILPGSRRYLETHPEMGRRGGNKVGTTSILKKEHV